MSGGEANDAKPAETRNHFMKINNIEITSIEQAKALIMSDVALVNDEGDASPYEADFFVDALEEVNGEILPSGDFKTFTTEGYVQAFGARNVDMDACQAIQTDLSNQVGSGFFNEDSFVAGWVAKGYDGAQVEETVVGGLDELAQVSSN